MTLRLLILFLISTALASGEAPPIEFRDGDRVVLVGNTFIERAQSYGHLETWLTTALADRKLSFRNLGWSGDTVYGHARSYFGPPQEGFDRLTKHLEELEPTMIISAYGAVAAFAGEPGIEDFVSGYRRLLDMFQKTGARLVLMSPPPAENLPAPLPNQDAHNERLSLYRDVIAKLAQDGEHGFADVYGALKEAWEELPHPLTDNGLHFTEAGYRAITPLVAQSLGVDPGKLSIELDASTGSANLEKIELDALSAGPEAVNLRARIQSGAPRPLRLMVKGLAEGHNYTIATEHRPLTKADAKDLAESIPLNPNAWNGSIDALRRAIVKKNELFFHRWRPQNETYLFGFRKHEQGNNAVEIPQFEPLISEQERRIQSLKVAPVLTLSITH